MRSVLAALCLFATTAHAVPAQFTHQGRLLDADGAPLDGEATITFRINDSDAGGTTLWEETLTLGLDNGPGQPPHSTRRAPLSKGRRRARGVYLGYISVR